MDLNAIKNRATFMLLILAGLVIITALSNSLLYIFPQENVNYLRGVKVAFNSNPFWEPWLTYISTFLIGAIMSRYRSFGIEVKARSLLFMSAAIIYALGRVWVYSFLYLQEGLIFAIISILSQSISLAFFLVAGGLLVEYLGKIRFGGHSNQAL